MANNRIAIVDYLVLDGDDGAYLVANECESCGAQYFDRRNGCGRCGGDRFRTQRLASEGVVRGYTIVHRAAPGVTVPYVSAVVELEGGGTVKANVVGVTPEPRAVTLGMPVQLCTFEVGTDDSGAEAIAFGFTPRHDTSSGKAVGRGE